ncbi:MAG: helix-turn-helix domain-containing protein [Oscillospiraceae bacterium]|jgi:transcriptional regulator with XRE-family HTH domain|nr:helix-turn-helix domain-containing protein [Oscillospiraceae bacterium]
MDYEAMGKRIRQFRKKQGYTQAVLADKVGISTSFMGHIERGTRIASLDTLVHLCEVLGVSLDTLVSGGQVNPINAETTPYKVRILNDVMRVLSEHTSEWLREE